MGTAPRLHTKPTRTPTNEQEQMMATRSSGKSSEESEPLNYGTFKDDDGNVRIAGSPEDAVRLTFDGWKLSKDATADPEEPPA